MPEVDTLKVASFLLLQHGNKAAEVAADKYKKAENVEDALAWIGILVNLRELLNYDPKAPPR